MQAQGHEIGAHTKSHPHLTTLSSAELQDEIAGSKQELINIGVNQVVTFSYPYGEFNDTVINAVKNAGYLGARNVEGGFNDKTTDKYLLESFSVESNTNISTVKSLIDSAIQDKTWLILLFHRTENNGGQYSITPYNLQQIVDYLIANNVLVVTNAQGIQILSQ
jgi:peptidoglycan/xylan/chitin deacetylase (PgdA/CDA1 family)